MAKKRTHRQFYRVLVIPDDKDEPMAFDLSMRTVNYLKIAAVILALHFIGGLIFYVQFFNVREKNKKLFTVNRQLEENMSKLNTLMAEFEVLQTGHDKIRNVLGLGTLNGQKAAPEILIPEEARTVNFLPDYGRINQQNRREETELEKYNFLIKNSNSPLHDHVKSIPTLLPVDGVLSADYENQTNIGTSQHRGIDIAGNKGDLVKASADGVVIFAGWTFDLGNLVIIYHGNGFYTYYGHNQRCLLPRGSFVKKGESIALLGSTGISSAPHLHFEIWKDGISYDPKDFILAFSNI
ncbi:M23 family metallopeptidase [candidate division KSB1 bacterium]|nr:M23 family metallopeptidase [candidate division KSB1 bacterium]RQW10992.1 MAG: M23 family metallopeptidase [candidate division KSB1 bacterium]